MPAVLEWNVNGLKTPLPDIRAYLHMKSICILALQKTHVTTEEGRLAGYLTYHMKSQRSDMKSRTLIYVRRTLYHSAVNLHMCSSKAAEYAALTLRVHGVKAAVLSIHVRPGVSWDPRELLQVRQHCAEFVFSCSDFKSHHE